MRTRTVAIAAGFTLLHVTLIAARGGDLAKKKAVVKSVESHQTELIGLADQIWGFAETALRETRSSRALADYAESQGFRVERGVAGMPTAFIASYGEGKPIIGILGEFDALPGLSQTASTHREALVPGAPGHGCGHNLFGPASLGAALAIKEQIVQGKIKGTIRFYGTPAEEAVGGKVYMARDGLFNDLDVCLAWHPDSKITADTQSSQAIVDFIIEFHGKAAHAAYDPWNGRSAVDALELLTHGLNNMREHVKPTVRIHYTIVKGGDVPNVVPEYAKLWCWIRDSKRAGVDTVLAWVRKMVQGAAMMSQVEGSLTVQAGDYEMLVNMTGEKLIHRNMEWLGPIQYTEEEQAFARAIQRATGVPEKGLDGSVQPLEEQKPDPPGGSTDVADVSWLVPTLHLSVTTAPLEAPWHAWPVVACGGMSIGHKGMLYAAKTIAATCIDLFEESKTREAIRAEFEQKVKGFVFSPYIPDGPPPVPKDVEGTE